MLRIVWISAFLGFFGHVTGAFAAAHGQACSTACREECPDHHCPPTCTSSLCGAPLAVEIPVLQLPEPTWPVPVAGADDAPPFAPDAPPLPDPREILRVPR